MNDWDKLYGAALEVQNERSVSSFIEAGSVAAALLPLIVATVVCGVSAAVAQRA